MPLPRLREIREKKMMTQEDLGKAAGLGTATIHRLEHNLNLARFHTVKRLADALGVAPAELLAPPEPPHG